MNEQRRGQRVIVQRDGDQFEVRSLGDDWRFWEDQFTGPWEPETKAVIDQYVRGGTYVDLGAWVGPTVLWGAKRARQVIAVEPDPVAYLDLVHNTGANCPDVILHNCAIGAPGRGLIRTSGEFGDSMSSTIRGSRGQPVDFRTIEDVIGTCTDVQLIKIDIEGAEGDVIPREVAYLRDLGAPVLLSLHPDWWETNPLPYLGGWAREQVSRYELLLLP